MKYLKSTLPLLLVVVFVLSVVPLNVEGKTNVWSKKLSNWRSERGEVDVGSYSLTCTKLDGTQFTTSEQRCISNPGIIEN